MAGAMDDKAAWLLADLTDSDIRRVAVLMFERIDRCVAQVKEEKEAAARRGRPTARIGPMRYGH